MKNFYILAAQSDPERKESVLCLDYDEAYRTAKECAGYSREPWCVYCNLAPSDPPQVPFRIINEKGDVVDDAPKS